MIFIRQKVELMDVNEMGEQLIEAAGRTCHKSEEKITPDSYIEFIRRMGVLGHKAMIEFGFLAMRIVCNRGVTHELVRHRLFSFAQESTRYCNYNGGVTFIVPPQVDIEERLLLCDVILETGSPYQGSLHDISQARSSGKTYVRGEELWIRHMQNCEQVYKQHLAYGWKAQQARGDLPIDVKTEICVGGNPRQWCHFFDMRLDPKAHPQMVEVANMALVHAERTMPTVFENYDVKEKS